eukprot:GHVP01011079.1.p1 GENE.GHVP01011079.1~~GHVP01011079.1.p1  ORF type:complete len:894 (-),score=119.00 GHVP01011079.1:558-3239(-)
MDKVYEREWKEIEPVLNRLLFSDECSCNQYDFLRVYDIVYSHCAVPCTHGMTIHGGVIYKKLVDYLNRSFRLDKNNVFYGYKRFYHEKSNMKGENNNKKESDEINVSDNMDDTGLTVNSTDISDVTVNKTDLTDVTNILDQTENVLVDRYRQYVHGTGVIGKMFGYLEDNYIHYSIKARRLDHDTIRRTMGNIWEKVLRGLGIVNIQLFIKYIKINKLKIYIQLLKITEVSNPNHSMYFNYFILPFCEIITKDLQTFKEDLMINKKCSNGFIEPSISPEDTTNKSSREKINEMCGDIANYLLKVKEKYEDVNRILEEVMGGNDTDLNIRDVIREFSICPYIETISRSISYMFSKRLNGILVFLYNVLVGSKEENSYLIPAYQNIINQLIGGGMNYTDNPDKDRTIERLIEINIKINEEMKGLIRKDTMNRLVSWSMYKYIVSRFLIEDEYKYIEGVVEYYDRLLLNGKIDSDEFSKRVLNIRTIALSIRKKTYFTKYYMQRLILRFIRFENCYSNETGGIGKGMISNSAGGGVIGDEFISNKEGNEFISNRGVNEFISNKGGNEFIRNKGGNVNGHILDFDREMEVIKDIESVFGKENVERVCEMVKELVEKGRSTNGHGEEKGIYKDCLGNCNKRTNNGTMEEHPYNESEVKRIKREEGEIRNVGIVLSYRTIGDIIESVNTEDIKSGDMKQISKDILECYRNNSRNKGRKLKWFEEFSIAEIDFMGIDLYISQKYIDFLLGFDEICRIENTMRNNDKINKSMNSKMESNKESGNLIRELSDEEMEIINELVDKGWIVKEKDGMRLDIETIKREGMLLYVSKEENKDNDLLKIEKETIKILYDRNSSNRDELVSSVFSSKMFPISDIKDIIQLLLLRGVLMESDKSILLSFK